MKKLIMAMLAGIVLPLYANAQLAKLMSKYHEQNCVTVTQLDKSLYGLYQQNTLPPGAESMLQKLDEVNLLNVNLSCDPEAGLKIAEQFRSLLNNPNKYRLIKSKNDDYGKQFIYTHSKNDKVSDLVVWNQNPNQLDIIELRGDIQIDQIAQLSRALNIKGLNSLAALSSDHHSYDSHGQSNNHKDRNADFMSMAQELQKMAERMQGQFGSGFNDIFEDFRSQPNDSIGPADHLFGLFSKPDAIEKFFGNQGISQEQMEKLFEGGNGSQQKVEKFFQSFGDGSNVTSNSVQITEENGKTKIKIDSKNSDMTYIIDGKQAPKDNIQMPEKILNVNMIPSKKDVKKSYLFITSKSEIGEFTNFKNGILTFKYDNQEYKYNLDKTPQPLLVIDGRLAKNFDIEPSKILQIRPISQIEKEVGYYPHAEVMINTK